MDTEAIMVVQVEVVVEVVMVEVVMAEVVAIKVLSNLEDTDLNRVVAMEVANQIITIINNLRDMVVVRVEEAHMETNNKVTMVSNNNMVVKTVEVMAHNNNNLDNMEAQLVVMVQVHNRLPATNLVKPKEDIIVSQQEAKDNPTVAKAMVSNQQLHQVTEQAAMDKLLQAKLDIIKVTIASPVAITNLELAQIQHHRAVETTNHSRVDTVDPLVLVVMAVHPLVITEALNMSITE